jgi:glutaredoxin
MPIQLTLYSTSHCHLCELAESTIRQLSKDIALQVVEIADDDNLFVKYGLRIPVLRRNNTGDEIAWPFNEADIQNLLKF